MRNLAQPRGTWCKVSGGCPKPPRSFIGRTPSLSGCWGKKCLKKKCQIKDRNTKRSSAIFHLPPPPPHWRLGQPLAAPRSETCDFSAALSERSNGFVAMNPIQAGSLLDWKIDHSKSLLNKKRSKMFKVTNKSNSLVRSRDQG